MIHGNTIELHIKNEQELNSLLECEIIEVGGTRFMREDLVKKTVADFGREVINKYKAEKEQESTEALNKHGVMFNEVAPCEICGSDMYKMEDGDLKCTNLNCDGHVFSHGET